MPLATEHLEIAQLYVRWPPERAPYAVELRLDLVSQLANELARGSQQGLEVGGVLLGRILPGHTPTLRVEAVEMIRRRPEDGPTFLLNPTQLNLLRGICEAAKSGGRMAIGLFRSQLRAESLRPSAADRTLMSDQFGFDPHVFLLAQGRAPHTSAFFIARGSELPPEPAIAEFMLNESALKALPEVPAEEPAAITRPVRQVSHSVPVWLLGLVAIVFAVLFGWLIARQPLRASLERSSNQIHLAAIPTSRNVVRITWSYSAPQVSRARGATVTIQEGSTQLQIALQPEELKYGAIAYQRKSSSDEMRIWMKLDAPDRPLPVQVVGQ